MLEYDLDRCDDRGLNFLIGMIVAHKFASILTDLDHRWRFRMGLSPESESCEYSIPLCIGSIPALFWQLLTGSPSWYPFALKSIRFPSSPRPACFWGRPRTRAASRRGAPEAAIYAGLKRWLEENLLRLIREGTFGWISEGSFLVFAATSDHTKSMAFCHIIALSNTSVFFQLRGADSSDDQRDEFEDLLKAGSDHGRCRGDGFLRTLWASYRAGCFPVTVPGFTRTTATFEELSDLDPALRAFWMFAAYCRVVSNAGTANIIDRTPAYAGRPADWTPACDAIYGAYFATRDLDDFDMVCRSVSMALENFRIHQVHEWFENSDLVENHPHIMRAFRLGCLLIWRCKIGHTPSPYDTAECQRFIDETVEGDAEAIPIAEAERKAVELEGSRSFFSLARPAPGKPEVVWLGRGDMQWSVFKFQRETMREFWAQECVFGMFFGEEDFLGHEVPHIGGDLSYHAVPTSDTPLGTPIYVSEIASSSHSVLDAIPTYIGTLFKGRST
jgi:hypothetical protein